MSVRALCKYTVFLAYGSMTMISNRFKCQNINKPWLCNTTIDDATTHGAYTVMLDTTRNLFLTKKSDAGKTSQQDYSFGLNDVSEDMLKQDG